jgi:hypothetical protein
MNVRTRKWYSFNDSSVHQVAPESCQRSSAYLLFYRRRQPGSAVPSLLAAGLPPCIKSIGGPGEIVAPGGAAAKKRADSDDDDVEPEAAAGAGAGMAVDSVASSVGGGGSGFNDFEADEMTD